MYFYATFVMMHAINSLLITIGQNKVHYVKKTKTVYSSTGETVVCKHSNTLCK